MRDFAAFGCPFYLTLIFLFRCVLFLGFFSSSLADVALKAQSLHEHKLSKRRLYKDIIGPYEQANRSKKEPKTQKKHQTTTTRKSMVCFSLVALPLPTVIAFLPFPLLCGWSLFCLVFCLLLWLLLSGWFVWCCVCCFVSGFLPPLVLSALRPC